MENPGSASDKKEGVSVNPDVSYVMESFFWTLKLGIIRFVKYKFILQIKKKSQMSMKCLLHVQCNIVETRDH